MANPSVRNVNRDRRSGQERSKPLPMVTRRFAAWAVEVGLIVTSGLIPFGIGMYAKVNLTTEQVPLNPVLVVTEDAIAKTFALPIDNNRNVAPLTNLFWYAALGMPLALSSWQLYLLAKTGSTLPKRWFGVRVVTAAGSPPGMTRILVREGVGSWGLPLAIAYLMWRYSAIFPSLAGLVGLSCLLVLAEGMSARFHRQRRCLHDRLAGTYVVDARRTFIPFSGRLSPASQLIQRESAQSKKVDTNVLTFTNVPGAAKRRQRSLWIWMRQYPSFTVLIVALLSSAAVLGTLVGTQVYIQNQATQRQKEQYKNEQLRVLVKQLNANPATLEERQKAILALGTLDDPQALQWLVNLLSEETDPTLVDTIEQSLASAGPRALPYLQRLNQSVSNKLELRYNGTLQEQEFGTQQLQKTQQAIAKILVLYSGNLHTVDLSRTNLGQVTAFIPFTLVLDQIDLSGIKLNAANLNQASLRGSSWRSVGEDRRWDTFDDVIADLSDAQIKDANLTDANLSRVMMNRVNLSRSILNHANLSGTHLSNANLSSAHLVGANLRDAVLANASLTGADLGEAIFNHANLSAARLGRVSALGTQLQFANLTQSDWQGADLSSADLSRANLANADFSAARLAGANLGNTKMENVNLRNADLTQADLRGANLAGADLQGAIFVISKQTAADSFIQTSPNDARSALVEGVDFSKAKNLDAGQLAYICTQGGRHPRCP
ncbi:MAG: pentapeptide repeat-containing protein [Gloeocapsa sp. UFS-A4-WI-NPMV-4B04]|nr:pentapeptide repeat-containing protein [Gloeocapsa sp. UFS-A4-WI-NPMV-4B04]